MNKMSAKHYIMFVFAVTIISLQTYSSVFITIGGRETWICTIIAFILLFLFALAIIHMAHKGNTYDMNEIFTLGLSKILGNIFLFIFALGLFLASVEAAAVEANCIKTNFFIDTPVWYIIIFFIFPSLFLIGKDFRTLLIFIITSVSSLIINSIILCLITEKYKDITFLLPIMGNGLTPSFFQCIFIILGSISAFSISLPFIKFLTSESKIRLHTSISLIIIGIYCIYSIMGIISTFGPLRASNLFYPMFTQGQRVEIGGFIEFGEFFFLYQTVVGLFIKYLLCSFGVYIIYHKYIKNHKVYLTIYSLAVFIAAGLLAKNNYYLFDILKYYSWSNLVFFILVPLIGFSAFALRKSAVQKPK